MTYETHRVRSLLRYLNYGQLKKDKLIPATPMFTAKTIPKVKPNKFTRKLAKSIGYSQYGLFMESIVEVCLNLRICRPGDLINKLLNQEPEKKLSPQEDLLRQALEGMSEFTTLLCSHFKECPEFQVEWKHGLVEGHPDIVSSDTVYDIKTTEWFNRMRIDTILQLLSYYCLAQWSYPDGRIKNIGLILPTQNCILTINLESWNWKGFWKQLDECVPLKIDRESKYSAPMGTLLRFQYEKTTHVGTHIHKKDLLDAIPLFQSRGLQFFVGGCCDSNVEVPGIFRKSLQKGVSATPQASVFIHAPYTLNIANPRGDYNRKEDSKKMPWTCERLIYLLKLGQECGLRGVVVHFGQLRSGEKKIKCKDGTCRMVPALSRSRAIINMMETVITVAQYATEECPLLLETPAGETGELCSDRSELISFFTALPERVRSRVGLCVDTCHVFSAGYRPDEYIQGLDREGIKISLFHYNDSYHNIGCRKDSHAPTGEGYVGLESLNNVLTYAILNRIPCVTE